MNNLKEKVIRGGFARLCTQLASFGVRLGSVMILARLLAPRDFGLVGMVTAFSGILSMFKDFGLSSATVQRATVTEEQQSTLFWINMLAGGLLGLLMLAAAPAIASFYREPRLVGVTAVLAVGFVLNAASIQHVVLLQRQLRFTALAVIGLTSQVLGTTIAILGAKAGYAYWALVAMTVTGTASATIGFWLITRWVPGRPSRGCGMRSLMRFGGTVTLNGLVIYTATNCEKVLLGRFWGANAIGLYGRAYQLINIPTDNLNGVAGEIAFAALSRLQDQPARLRSYFLKGYSLIIALTLPITMTCALFAEDVISVLLGPKWKGVAPLLRLLAPTILVFAIANPLSWFLFSIGRVGQLLKMGFVIAPIMIASYIAGLHYGPKGVAFSYSAVMTLWLIPLLLWALHDTIISARDVLVAASRPVASIIVATAVAVAARPFYAPLLSPWSRLVLESATVFVIFFGVLLFVTGQKAFYLGLIRGLVEREAAVAENDTVSV